MLISMLKFEKALNELFWKKNAVSGEGGWSIVFRRFFFVRLLSAAS